MSPRKDCTAIEVDEGDDGHDTDPAFVVLTFHHGLGKSTRIDVDYDQARGLINTLGDHVMFVGARPGQ